MNLINETFPLDDPNFDYVDGVNTVDFLLELTDKGYEEICNRTNLLEQGGFSSFEEWLDSDCYIDAYSTFDENGGVSVVAYLNTSTRQYECEVPLTEGEKLLLYELFDCFEENLEEQKLFEGEDLC